MKQDKETIIRTVFISAALLLFFINFLVALLYPENKLAKIPADVEQSAHERMAEYQLNNSSITGKPLLYFLQDAYRKYRLMKALQQTDTEKKE